MGIWEESAFHPWPAILGGVAVLLNAFLLVRRPQGRRAWLLPATIGFACAAVAVGIFGSAWATIAGVRAMASAGLKGQGPVAALLADERGTLFVGLVAAALVLATGLLLARGGDDEWTTEAASGSSMASQLRTFLALSALISVLVAALGAYDLLFTASLPQQIYGADAKANPQEAAEVIGSHLIRLEILSGLGLIASAFLAILPSRLTDVAWPPRSLARWGRALLLVLLILAVTGATLVWGQQARFVEAAGTGQIE